MSAEFPTPDDLNAIRGLILAQLAAFADDDADLAFSFASSAIRESFGTAEAFLQMVREYYPHVYRAQGALFSPLSRYDERRSIQNTRLIDATGRRREARYEVIREANNWRIDGCSYPLIGVWSAEG